MMNHIIIMNGVKNPNLTDVASDDAVLMYTQYSTQWDALAHRGALFDVKNDDEKPVYYNGFSAGFDISMTENQTVHAHALGIENMAVHGVQEEAF